MNKAAEEAEKLITAASSPYFESLKGDAKKNATRYETAKVVDIPDVDNCVFVSLEPTDAMTNVSDLACWIVEQLAQGAKWAPRPTHVSRMIPVEGIANELELMPLAANLLPEHFESVSRAGLRSSTYEVTYEEHSPSVHIFPSVVNGIIGDTLPEGYAIDLKAPAHTILVVVAGEACFMSVCDKYRDRAMHFALHKALAKTAAACGGNGSSACFRSEWTTGVQLVPCPPLKVDVPSKVDPLERLVSLK